MDKINYTVHSIPPSINKYIGRTNRYEYQEDKKTYAKIVDMECHPKPKTPLDNVIISLHFCFNSNAGRDLDNYQKFVLDALVKSKIIVDDSWQHCKVLTSAEKDAINPRVEITIE